MVWISLVDFATFSAAMTDSVTCFNTAVRPIVLKDFCTFDILLPLIY